MSATLTTLRDRVEVVLMDTTNAKWDTGTLDEAIRAATAAYSSVCPVQGMTALTLATAGREISLSSLTTLLHVLRVWWEYTSTAPEYPPKWREFEVWPGPVLWINDGEEPGAGDIVRVFYTSAHTLSGLDSATVTTIPDAHITPLVQGTAGFAALSRAVDRTEMLNVDGWDFKRLQEYAEGQLAHFDAWLKQLATAEAVQRAGIAPTAALDRWEGHGW